MRIEIRTTVLLLALVMIVAAFTIPTTLADHGNKNSKDNDDNDDHNHIPNVEGEGRINSTVMPNISKFEFEAKNNSGVIKGELEYRDIGAGIKLHGNVTMLDVNKTAMPMTANFSGTARVTNATGAKMWVSYTVNATDGKKGVGTFSITLNTTLPFLAPYSDSGTLLRGEIEIDP